MNCLYLHGATGMALHMHWYAVRTVAAHGSLNMAEQGRAAAAAGQAAARRARATAHNFWQLMDVG
jgi:hypothetical protein